MNERIRELLDQATSYKEGDTEGLHDIEVFDKEKFAELIVRECALVVYKKTGPKSALDVLEHFGVEE